MVIYKNLAIQMGYNWGPQKLAYSHPHAYQT